jgi:hypothetical protein
MYPRGRIAGCGRILPGRVAHRTVPKAHLCGVQPSDGVGYLQHRPDRRDPLRFPRPHQWVQIRIHQPIWIYVVRCNCYRCCGRQRARIRRRGGSHRLDGTRGDTHHAQDSQTDPEGKLPDRRGRRDGRWSS